MSPRTRRRGLRALKTRLLIWLLAAIALAVGASAAVMALTRSSDSEVSARVVSRHVVGEVVQRWDDPAELDAYVAKLRSTTGLEVRVRREARRQVSGRGRVRAGAVVFEDGAMYVPILKRGAPIGTLELRTGVDPPRAWRVVVALASALLVLGIVARRVSGRLARPLEHVAATAERFGAGDLEARTGVDKLSRRWVAEEVGEVGRAFDAMADRIARVVLEQRELLAAISHELRSPLGRARIALEIARERVTPPPAPDPAATASESVAATPARDGAPPSPDAALVRSLGEVDRQLVEIDTILGDLLASARAGLADVRRERVDLVAWLTERARSDVTGPISVVGPRTALVVEIDSALLGRALHNVFANARAHGHPRDVPLEVSVSVEGDTVRVSVRDHGPGFAADILPRAFDPFVTGTDRARSPGDHGIGLGLSLVRRIVEAHGGRASAANVEGGGGAVVSFSLPRSLPRTARRLGPNDAVGTVEPAR